MCSLGHFPTEGASWHTPTLPGTTVSQGSGKGVCTKMRQAPFPSWQPLCWINGTFYTHVELAAVQQIRTMCSREGGQHVSKRKGKRRAGLGEGLVARQTSLGDPGMLLKLAAAGSRLNKGRTAGESLGFAPHWIPSSFRFLTWLDEAPGQTSREKGRKVRVGDHK